MLGGTSLESAGQSAPPFLALLLVKFTEQRYVLLLLERQYLWL